MASEHIRDNKRTGWKGKGHVLSERLFAPKRYVSNRVTQSTTRVKTAVSRKLARRIQTWSTEVDVLQAQWDRILTCHHLMCSHYT